MHEQDISGKTADFLFRMGSLGLDANLNLCKNDFIGCHPTPDKEPIFVGSLGIIGY